MQVGDINASTAAQVGDLYLVTVDSSGTLGRQAATTTSGGTSMLSLASLMPAAVTDAQFDALTGRVGALEGRVDDLFDLAQHERKQNRRGIAAAMAMADAPMPSAPGKTSYAAKSSTFRGEFAMSASLTHRLGTQSPFAVTAGVSHAGGKNTGATVGFAGEF